MHSQYAIALVLSLALFVVGQQAPDGSITPCDFLYLRGTCGDLAPGVISFPLPSNLVIPSNDLSGRFTHSPPPNPDKIVSFLFEGLYGEFDDGWTELRVSVDALTVSGLSLGWAINYDFEGDGVWDRVEIPKDFSLNNQVGYQEIVREVKGVGDGANAIPKDTWDSFYNGKIELQMWSAFNTTGELIVQTDGPSYMRIPFVYTYGTPPAPALPQCAIQSTTGTSKNRVAFVLSDVEDYYCAEATIAVLNLFKSNGNVPLTLGILSADFGENPDVDSAVTIALTNPNWNVEVGCLGYDYSAWNENLTLAEQVDQMVSCQDALFGLFGITPTTFFPPASIFNDQTLPAVRRSGLKIYSPPKYAVEGPYAMQHSSFYTFPHGASGTDDLNYQEMKPIATVFADMETQMTNDGFAVIELSSIPYATLDGEGIRQENLDQLDQLIKMVLQAGYEVVPVNGLPLDVENSTNGITIKDCNCVAFRLDDLQDYYVTAAQQAVISVFEEFQAPLTVGIIGYDWGNDTVHNDYINRAIANATDCYKLEIANHGWLHEDFSTLPSEEQDRRLGLAQLRITHTTKVTPITFIPPYNAWNEDLIANLKKNGLTHMTSEEDVDGGAHNYDNATLWRFPIGASTSVLTSDGGEFIGVSHLTTWASIQEQRSFRGWSVVMMHPQEFSYFDGTDYLNIALESQLDELRLLIATVRAAGLRIVTVGEIETFFGNTEPDPCLDASPTMETEPTSSTSSSSSTQTSTNTQTTTSTNTQTTTSTNTQTTTSTNTQSSTSTTEASTGTQSTSSQNGDKESSATFKSLGVTLVLFALGICL